METHLSYLSVHTVIWIGSKLSSISTLILEVSEEYIKTDQQQLCTFIAYCGHTSKGCGTVMSPVQLGDVDDIT